MTIALCECGCGLPVRVIYGKPRRFAGKGHNGRRAPDLTRVKIVATGYETECWEWLGNVLKDGYGQIQVSGSMKQAHRVSFETVNGPIQSGLQLDHLCRNRSCIRPDHLEIVTQAENTQRGLSAKLSKEQVLLIRNDKRPAKEIAQDFGISPNHAFLVRNAKVWRNIKDGKP